MFTDVIADVVDNRGRTCPTVASGIPLIATNCVKNDLLYPAKDNVRFVSDETHATWFRGHPRPGDLIFVLKGSPGRVCLAPDPVDFCIAQDMVAVRANADRVDPRFLFALLRSDAIQQQINQLHVGSLIPHFKKGDFDKLILDLPPRATQVAIGRIYYELSAKIELNRRMNETLEGLARALFKSWFVDFDPVRAKAAGRQPVGMDAETARLFPDRFGSEAHGEVPVGWKVHGLDEIATFLNGLALQKFPAQPGAPSLPVIKIAELRSGITSKSDRASTSVPSQYVVGDGDVLFSWSGSLEVVIWSGGPGALNQHLFKVTSDTYPLWFVHAWVEHHLPAFRTIAADKATTMGHIQRRHLSEAKAFVPSPELLAKASSTLEPMWQRRARNSTQSRTLATLRDSLLPKLLSGELRVRDAVSALGTAT